jgi:hypothetical protein
VAEAARLQASSGEPPGRAHRDPPARVARDPGLPAGSVLDPRYGRESGGARHRVRIRHGPTAMMSSMRARSSWTRFVAVTLLLYTGAGLIYHIQITEAPIGRCLDHDTRDQLITELTPGIQARRPAYTLDGLRALCGTQTQIRVSGWLLYDLPHKGDSGRSTPWEVHP